MKAIRGQKGLICWKDMSNGIVGIGLDPLPFSDVRAMMDIGEKHFPMMRHWFIPIGIDSFI